VWRYNYIMQYSIHESMNPIPRLTQVVMILSVTVDGVWMCNGIFAPLQPK
jgi:hypothetical protein